MIFFFDAPKISINHGLQDHIDVFLVVEDGEQPDDVFVGEVEVYFDLPKEVFLVFVALLYIVLVDNLEGENHSRLEMESQMDLPLDTLSYFFY